MKDIHSKKYICDYTFNKIFIPRTKCRIEQGYLLPPPWYPTYLLDVLLEADLIWTKVTNYTITSAKFIRSQNYILKHFHEKWNLNSHAMESRDNNPPRLDWNDGQLFVTMEWQCSYFPNDRMPMVFEMSHHHHRWFLVGKSICNDAFLMAFLIWGTNG